jgi:hypothetical protein
MKMGTPKAPVEKLRYTITTTGKRERFSSSGRITLRRSGSGRRKKADSSVGDFQELTISNRGRDNCS